jgi:tetratricopeptide (TPR) repeat protein
VLALKPGVFRVIMSFSVRFATRREASVPHLLEKPAAREAWPWALPFAWVVEGAGRVLQGDGVRAFEPSLLACLPGEVDSPLSGCTVVISAGRTLAGDVAGWLGAWRESWEELREVVDAAELADFPRFLVVAPREAAVPAGFACDAADDDDGPIPVQHLHPDLQDRLACLQAADLPLTADEVAATLGVTVPAAQQDLRSLVRAGHVLREGSAFRCAGAAACSPERLEALQECVLPLVEAHYARHASPRLGERLLTQYLRRGDGRAPAVALQVLEAHSRADRWADASRVAAVVAPHLAAWAQPSVALAAARALARGGRGDGARAALDTLPAEHPEGRRLRARLALERGELDAALALLPEGGDARDCLARAEVLVEAGRVAEAERLLRPLASAPLAVAAPGAEDVPAEVHNLLGRVYLSRGELDAALESFDAACGSRNPAVRARGLLNKSLVFLAREDYRQAVDLLQRCHVLASEAGQERGAALTLYNLGVTYESLGNYPLALSYLRDALAAFRSNGFGVELSHGLVGVADVYLTLGRLRGARGLLRVAEHLARRHGQPVQALGTALREVRLDLELGELEAAATRLADVRASLGRDGSLRERLIALALQAELRLRQGGGEELKVELRAVTPAERAAVGTELSGFLRLFEGALRRDLALAEEGFRSIERPGNPWESFRAAGLVADLCRSKGEADNEAAWREVAQGWLERFRGRVPEGFRAAVEARPAVARHLSRVAELKEQRAREARRAVEVAQVAALVAPATAEPECDAFPVDLNQLKTDLEVRFIREALVRTEANIAAAARLLGMKRPRLSQKIRELDIDLDRIRRLP